MLYEYFEYRGYKIKENHLNRETSVNKESKTYCRTNRKIKLDQPLKNENNASGAVTIRIKGSV